MKTKIGHWLSVLVIVSLLQQANGVFAEPPPPPEILEIQTSLQAGQFAPGTNNSNSGVLLSGMTLLYEMEPNDTPATANPLPGTDLVIQGYIFPNGDLDYFSFTGNAGDRVYAATMTSFSPGSTDTTLTLFDADGVTVIEEDVNDGSFSATSSSIAGATLPAAGIYYLQVRATSAAAQVRPYSLYLKVQSGAPTPEAEPNNLADGAQPLPPSGWVNGSINPAADNDVFTLDLNAGDTVFLSLDMDPARAGGTTWNGRVGLGAFGNPPNIIVINDPNTESPNSEAFFFTVKEAGAYYVYVDHPTALGDPTYTYHLSVSIIPQAPEAAFCTTYTSTDVPVAIPTGPGMVQSTLTVPGNPRIADLNVTLVLDHTNMPDLDVVLVAPDGNEVVLFNDRGINTQTQMNLTLDDEAAIPINSYSIMSGIIYQPQSSSRLSWFDGQNAGGVWTLKLYDDLADNGGALQRWSLTICEPPPLACPVGYTPVTVFSSDFEANNGGFTTAGTNVDWAWGTPTVAPIDACNSGSNCWKTNLNGDYSISSNQDLRSPAIDLSGFSGPAIMRWAQKYQMESASFDGAYIQVQEAGGANPTRLWTWLDGTMRSTVGNPGTTIQQSAGWGEHWADISSYAGQSIEALFHLDSDTTVNLAGLAIDDFSITACALPSINLTKTVGTDPSTCALTDEIAVPAGADVTYCYEVENTGDVTLNLHDLDDSELGSILSAFPYALSPGASAFLTATSTISATTVNTAMWTAYNAGPTDVVTATDTATVTVLVPAIALTKTVGTDPETCAFTDEIAVPAGTDVTYCYEIENTGDITLNLHDLDDSELGALLSGFPYALSPGASAFLTQTTTITTTTVNTATWTAYNAGPIDVVTATDTATVTVTPRLIFLPLVLKATS